jgi:hypothetical protein
MSKVFSAHAVSVDGYISGRTPDGDEEFGRGLGDAPMLFDCHPRRQQRVLEARWFTASELRARIADPSLGGPYRVDSIGKFLIEDWLASQA